MPFSMRFETETGRVIATCSGTLGVKDAREAFVTARDVDFGLARMFQVIRQNPSTQVRVFRDYEDAVSWAQSRG